MQVQMSQHRDKHHLVVLLAHLQLDNQLMDQIALLLGIHHQLLEYIHEVRDHR